MAPALALMMLLAAAPAAAPAAPAASDDVALRALVDELTRSRGLKMESAEPPYHLIGYLNDNDTFTVQASFGALTHRSRDRRRTANVLVRVGSPALDNTAFADREHFDFMEMFAEHSSPVPEDADYDALRQALWLRFDTAYKSAVEKLARKRAFLETNAVPDRPADFAAATVSRVTAPRAKLEVDQARWTHLVEASSASFRDLPGTAFSYAWFQASADNQYYATSDPIDGHFGDTKILFALGVSGQAPDGMELEVKAEVAGRTEADLPKDAELLKLAREVGARLAALEAAPLLPEDYSGPVLFTRRAAARFFLNAIGEPLSHPRSPLDERSEGRLVDRLGKHIASSIVTVRDDPTQKTWHGQPLMGWFPVDDEGVKPQALTLVEQGQLKTYYMSRVPTAKVAQTNGHARSDGGSVGNLFVEGGQPKSLAALKKQLLALAKEDDLEYGLVIEELEEQSEESSFESMMLGRHGGASGDIRLPAPLVTYRVFPDGRQELVRGVSFKSVSFSALREIVAMGDEPTLLNTRSLNQNVSVVAPSVLVKQLELKKVTREFDKPPRIPRPTADTTASK